MRVWILKENGIDLKNREKKDGYGGYQEKDNLWGGGEDLTQFRNL